MAGAVCGAVVLAAPVSAAPVTTWSALQAAVGAGGTVTLGADLVPPDVPSGERLDLGSATTTIDLNGHRLTIDSPPANEAAIHVAPSASLTVQDSVGSGLLTVTGGSGGDAAIGGDFIGSVSESDGPIAFAAGSHTVINAGTGGHTIGPSGVDANARWTNAGTLTLNGLTPMDGQSNDGLINASTGIIYLNGSMFGAGTLTNDGVIVVGPSPDGISTGYTWIGNHYVISYKINYSGGTDPATQTVYGPTIASTTQSLPAIPTRTGFVHHGWYTAATGGTKVTNSSALASLYSPAQDTPTFYVHWGVSQELVTFDSAGGSAVPAQDIDYGGTATSPPNPQRTGYSFDGWYTAPSGGTAWTFGSPITQPITLYAHWSAAASPPPSSPTGTASPSQPGSGTATSNQPTRSTSTAVPVIALAGGSPAATNLFPPGAGTSPGASGGGTSGGGTAGGAGPQPSPQPSPFPSPQPSPPSPSPPGATPTTGSAAGSGAGAGVGSAIAGRHQPLTDQLSAKATVLTHGLPSTWSILRHPERLAWALGMGLVWTLLLVIATGALQQTMSTRYAAWSRFLKQRRRARPRRLARALQVLLANPGWLLVVVLAVNAAVSGFVDPSFGLNWTSAREYLSLLLGAVIGRYLPFVIAGERGKRMWGVSSTVSAAPWGLLICALGVGVSRALSFVPGLLTGSTVQSEPDGPTAEQQVKLEQLEATTSLAVGAVSWALYQSVPASGSWLTLCVHDAAAAGTIVAFTTTFLTMLPLSYFPGGVLFQRARRSWVVLTAAAALAFLLVVVPQPRYWLYVGSRQTWWATIAAVMIGVVVLIMVTLHRAERRGAKSQSAVPAKESSPS